VSASKAALSSAVGKHVAEAAHAAIKTKGSFNVAISGGSLPKLLASGLLSSYAADTDTKVLQDHFGKWRVFFADERCVSLDSDESNSKGAKAAFLSKVPIPAANIHDIDPSLDPRAMASAYQLSMTKTLGAQASLDMILLGMGPDGHTCSLFPGHPLLLETKRLVAHIEDSPKPPKQRITLTFPVLQAAEQVTFVTAGASKAAILPKVLAKDSKLPAGQAHAKDKTVTWFVDADAALQCSAYL